MYFIEAIIKKFINRRNKPDFNHENQEKEYFCKHVYLPLDSTGRILACNKCGDVIKNTDNIKPKNPFG